MLVLRVRCVDDGRELLLERHGADEHSIQVVELKKLVLQQRQHIYRNGDVVNPSDSQPSGLEDCFVLLRGQILADPDVVGLNALSPSDFFVFAPDAPQSTVGSSSRSEMHKHDADSATFEVLLSQLVDMGFSAELAAQALRQSGNNLSDAASLLAEGKVHAVSGDDGSMHNETATDLMTQHPSIAPLRSLVYDENMRRLQELAATDSFQALLLLKEQFSSEMLNRLNENSVATLQLLSLPVPTLTTSSTTVEMEQFSEDVLGVESEDMVETTSSSSNDAVDRVRKNVLTLICIYSC